MPGRALVVGATGDLGSRVVRRLLRGGHDVRYLSRGQGGDGQLRELGATAVRGELTDTASLRDACRGVDTVVATATVMARRLAGQTRQSIAEVDRAGMCSLVEAAERHGVSRFLYMSFAGADRGVGSPLEHAKLAVERQLQAASMQSVSIRADGFQEIHLRPIGRFDLHGGKVSVIGKGATRRRLVSIEDVAALIAALADERDPPEVVEFGGPELISRNEAIAVAERVLGRRMKVQRMPRQLARIGMRALSSRNDSLASVFGAGLHQDLVEADWDDSALTQRGINPQSVSRYIELQSEHAADV